MQKRVLLAEQHLRRGVDTNALIAAYLEGMGVETRLSLTGAQLYSNLIHFEPHVVYYPWVTPYVCKFLRERAPAVPIVNAFQEQDAALYEPDTPMVQLAGKADYLFAWGKAYKQKFQELFSEPEVVLTGNPRYDPYLDPHIADALYPTRSELAQRYDLPEEKDWVLLALDFPHVFESETRLNELIDQGQLTIQDIETTRTIYRALGKWMRRFRTEDQDAILVVRPHPGSDLGQIKKDFGGETETIRYIKGGGMPPWIIAADRYVTRTSTSVVEAWLANTSTGLILKKETLEGGDSRPHLTEAERSLSTYSEFQDFITGKRKEEGRVRHQEFLSSHYRLDGRSALRTARAIRRIVSRQKNDISYNGGRMENIVEHVKFALKKVVSESGINQWNPFDRPNGEFLSQRDADRKVDSIASYLDKNREVKDVIYKSNESH